MTDDFPWQLAPEDRAESPPEINLEAADFPWPAILAVALETLDLRRQWRDSWGSGNWQPTNTEDLMRGCCNHLWQTIAPVFDELAKGRNVAANSQERVSSLFEAVKLLGEVTRMQPNGDDATAIEALEKAIANIRAAFPVLAGAQRQQTEVANTEPPATGASKQSEGDAEQFIFAPSGSGYFIAGFGESGYVGKLKGFGYLAKLVAQPGTPILMTELLAAEPKDAATDRHSRQPAMDAQAKREAKERLQELQEEIDDAKERGDVRAQERATEEMERLTDELKAATGLLGKDRDLNNPTNRHRSRIHNRLVDAYKAIRSTNPPMNELANHFEAAVSAEGATFVYRPVPAIFWRTNQ